MLTLGVSSHQENFCSLQLIFGLASTSQGYPRITFCIPNTVTKNCVSFCLPLTSRLVVTYSLIEPSWFFIPSTFITAISFHKLRMRRLCSFAKTRSIKIPVAPESTRAMVSTFQPFICRVTERCIVFHSTLLSPTRSDQICSELVRSDQILIRIRSESSRNAL